MVISIVASLIIFFSPFLLKKRLSSSEIITAVTTLGIFGTFLGILIGLWNFDVTDQKSIFDSVPILLDGLRTAFLTSIAGMLAGIIVKLWPKFYGISEVLSRKEEASLESIVSILQNISDDQSTSIQQNKELLTNIEKALCGDGETTLLTQIQKLRTIVADKQDELKQAFNEFADKMAENNSKALIDALTEVMKDFNAKINEQFGDNFKQLNEAVGRMLTWQENYKQQIEALTKQMNDSIQAIKECEQSIVKITNNSESFSKIAFDLKEVLDESSEVRSELNDHLVAFAELAAKAKKALPTIETEITRLTSEFSKRVNESLEISESSLKKQDEALKTQKAAIDSSQNHLSEAVNKLVTDLNNRINTLMTENTERIAKQVEELDKALGEELTKSLSSLGSQLTSLSKKFVDDYEPLTTKLRQLVQIANEHRDGKGT